MSTSNTTTERYRSEDEEEIIRRLQRAVNEYAEITAGAIRDSEQKTISSAEAGLIIKEAAAKVNELTREYDRYAKNLRRKDIRSRSTFDVGNYNIWYGVLIGIVVSVLAMAVANETIN